MAQTELIALMSFEHNGSIKRGQHFFVTEKVAEKFKQRGLARAVGDGEQQQEKGAPPLAPAGEDSTSSASPADPASPQTTANESGSGASPRKQKKSDASSS